MRKIAALLFASLLFSLAPLAHADLAAIHVDKLPQETAVLAAFDDAQQLEPYSHSWSNKWQFPIAKEEVATRLGKDLGFLTIALKSHPDNAELLLLTGLVAHYAYNLDVEGSYDIAVNTLGQAQKLVPSEVRAPWFRATLLCQTMKPKDGADEFLSIEANHAWDQLPAGFWLDYMECASVTNMPAHLLRAADHLEKLQTPMSEMRNYLSKTAHNQFVSFDPKKQYTPKELWVGANAGENPDFTSTTCGVLLRAHGNWEINQIGPAKSGGCIAYFNTGPYKAITRKLSPSILLLIQQPHGNETLDEFSKKYMKYEKDAVFEPFTPTRCSAATCIAMKGVQPGMYKKDGDGHGRFIAFERNQPEYPGLIFERPYEIPKSDGKEGLSYYHPNQTQQRIPGKLYYLVLLDTAASIEEPALKDFNFFLENLTVE
ncbi:MAG: hypothetical protein ABR991_03480 [Terracidiphilus sp.]